jgi:hypothetical protein
MILIAGTKFEIKDAKCVEILNPELFKQFDLGVGTITTAPIFESTQISKQREVAQIGSRSDTEVPQAGDFAKWIKEMGDFGGILEEFIRETSFRINIFHTR